MIQIKYVKTEDQEAGLLTKGMVRNFRIPADRLTGNTDKLPYDIIIE